MRNRFVTLSIFYSLIFFHIGKGQNFVNGDLEGIVTGISCLPDFWQGIPYSDLNCEASNSGYDSPDLTNITGPILTDGRNGNPFSGQTFICGAYGININPFYKTHEGIMQVVSWFTVGQTYKINFRQSINTTSYARDNSGSWAIYIDTVLAGITEPSFSDEPFNSINIQWDARRIVFTATSTSHVIKFLPMDNDTNLVFSLTDTTGALYMGIDSISLSIVTGLEEPEPNLGINLYPNPAQHQLNITLEKAFSGNIYIRNMLAQEVYIQVNPNSQVSFSIDVGTLPAGVYILGFENERGVVRKKFVKRE
jgi:hypothetical protein